MKSMPLLHKIYLDLKDGPLSFIGVFVSNLLAARLQMAISLGFHILFAVVGIALPLMMAVAEAFWLRTRDPVYRILASRWARGAAILFAVGAVSGTVLSFELGLLWPHFMKFAGPIIGLGFGLEGFAFFTEAIFLGIYIYGWDRVPPLVHWLAGAIIALSGALGHPRGFGQRLDEHAGRLCLARIEGHQHRPAAGAPGPGNDRRNAAHDARGVRGDGVASCRNSCGAAAQQSG